MRKVALGGLEINIGIEMDWPAANGTFAVPVANWRTDTCESFYANVGANELWAIVKGTATMGGNMFGLNEGAFLIRVTDYCFPI